VGSGECVACGRRTGSVLRSCQTVAARGDGHGRRRGSRWRICAARGSTTRQSAGLLPARTQEAEAVRKTWNGPASASGQRLWFGLERGTPLTGLAGNNAFPIASTYFQHWIRQNPQFDWHTLSEADFASDFLASQRKFHDVIGTDDPNLERFRKHGGKMIIWHGEADPLIFPRGTVNYFDRVLAANGGAQEVKQFARLFLAPGVGHCGGGEGPNPVGVFDALVNWVEKGVAPDTVPATRRRQDGTVVARPLCAYPETARWMGNGSPDDAANFVCVDGQHRSGDFRVADPPRN
jgi:hypothetical protein